MAHFDPRRGMVNLESLVPPKRERWQTLRERWTQFRFKLTLLWANLTR